MVYTPDELLIKTDDLKGMHEHSGHYEYRDRVRSIMNGGSNGIAALLGESAKIMTLTYLSMALLGIS